MDATKTVDNRRKRPDDPLKYGIDPRLAASDIAADSSVRTTSGKVGEMESLGQLQDAIDQAGAAGSFVAIKFVRDGCAACASTAAQFEETAKEYAGAGSLFYLVNYDRARDFCKQAKLKFVPAAHLYSRNELQAALPLGKKKWDDFYAKVQEVHKELQ